MSSPEEQALVWVARFASSYLAGKTLDNLFGRGGLVRQWFGRPIETARAAALQNTDDFGDCLAAQLQQREGIVDDDPAVAARVAAAMEDPDVLAVLCDAIRSAARTDSRERHELLARLVADRLLVDAGSPLALNASMACEAIRRLAPRHLRLLAVIVYVERWRGVRPSVEHAGDIEALDTLAKDMAMLLPASADRYDRMQMEAASCVAGMYSLGRRPMTKMLARACPSLEEDRMRRFCEEADIGQRLMQIWKNPLSVCILTTVGELLGIRALEQLLEVTVCLDGSHWEE